MVSFCQETDDGFICGRIVQARKKCQRHYNRWYAKQDVIEKLPIKATPIVTTCPVKEKGVVCDRKSQSKSTLFCPKHFARFKRHGDPLVVKKRGPKNGTPFNAFPVKLEPVKVEKIIEEKPQVVTPFVPKLPVVTPIEVPVAKTREDGSCVHYWEIESPNGATACGRCKRCGEVRYNFTNSNRNFTFGNNTVAQRSEPVFVL